MYDKGPVTLMNAVTLRNVAGFHDSATFTTLRLRSVDECVVPPGLAVVGAATDRSRT